MLELWWNICKSCSDLQKNLDVVHKNLLYVNTYIKPAAVNFCQINLINSFYQEVQDTYVLYGIIEFVKICTVKIILVLIINW